MNRTAPLLPLALVLAACTPDPPPMATGIFGPLGTARPNATAEEQATFARGLAVAQRRFSRPEGLGPNFNVSFCGACHEKPTFGGTAGHYRDFLLVAQRLDDGSFIPRVANGVQPQFTVEPRGYLESERFINIQAGRNPIPFFGVGLLAEIPDEEILRRADEDDADGDGISGRANFDRGFVGRFGRKSQTVSIEGFIRGPLFNHLGITSDPLPAERQRALPVPSGTGVATTSITTAGGRVAGRVDAQAAAPDEPTRDVDLAPDPELSEDDLFDLISFSMLLAAPEPDAPTEQSTAGARVFERIGCEGCHTPTLEGPRGLIPAYSDLLLHDMGDDLADGIEAGLATGREFRTQPLWGIIAASPYLHDGRATTLDEAILAHGGEAEPARGAYEALDTTDKDRLMAFLASLGGASQASEGLLPPSAPIPAPGTPGAPVAALDTAGAERFIRGRALFDRDLGFSDGLGPVFNGDACRACHFDPVIGGAGPIGVDVIRHGTVEDGLFEAPVGGTILPRHSTDFERREPGMTVNVFEPRQTPSLLGLGLLQRIDESDILALEDPNDMDADGISGRAHRLSDGRLGRFGWKAQVPTLAEFARDAISAEMGITVPASTTLTFGAVSDSDGVPDPEISEEALRDLEFFMGQLAPPPRRSEDAALEAAGEALFTTLECNACHTPSHAIDGGAMTISPYTDLLLHDVAPLGAPGIDDDDATQREFRTPPLWGLAQTAPYMHHGRAVTIEDAIAAHESEASAARMAYEALDADDRAALLAFLRSL